MNAVAFKDNIKQALYFKYDQNLVLRKIYDEYQQSQMTVPSYFVAGQLFSNIVVMLESIQGFLKDKQFAFVGIQWGLWLLILIMFFCKRRPWIVGLMLVVKLVKGI